MQRANAKLLIIAYFDARGVLSDDFRTFLKLSSSSFDVHVFHIDEIVVLKADFPNVKFTLCAVAGYDLNAYLFGAVHYMYSKDVEQYIFMNNSIEIVNPGLFMRTLELMFDRLTLVDFIAMTKSFEETEHYQSYLFGLNKRILSSHLFRNLIEDGSFLRPFSRFEVIQYFELNTLNSLKNDGFSHDNFYKPNRSSILIAYFRYLVCLGFVDNSQGLFYPKRINMSTYSKSEMAALYGFRKIKNSSILNKVKKVYERFTKRI